MDEIIDFKNFYILNSGLTDPKLIKRVRLLSVFGNIGSEVIFVTNEDKVYGFGTNKNGCLGLATFEKNIETPRLNQTLSGKDLVDIVCCYEHCIGLTSDGQCYGWGHNECGRLGIGTFDRTHTPLLITEMANQRVVQIACGTSHTLALTVNGQVYSWGGNQWGQLGVRHYKSRYLPNLIEESLKIVQISCGRNHSVALTDTSQVIVWGLNDHGQLGIHPNSVSRNNTERPSTGRPHILANFSKSYSVVKVICGPNHTLLLTADGLIHGFGDNNHGQVGSGHHRSKFYPNRISLDSGSKIIDIVANNQNDLSMAVTKDNKCYVFGAIECKTTHLSAEESLFNIFGRLIKYKITYRTIVITEQNKWLNELKCKLVLKPNGAKPEVNAIQMNPLLKKSSNSDKNDRIRGPKPLENNKNEDNSVESNTKPSNDRINDKNNDSLDEMSNPTKKTKDFDTNSVQSIDSDYHSCIGPISAGIKLLRYLSESFDKRETSDLLFNFRGRKTIYCHKTILKIRNKKFWDTSSLNLINYTGMSANLAINQEIFIRRYSYESFYAFLKYLYGIEPHLNHRYIDGVLMLAKIYEEPGLLDLCYHYMQTTERSVNVNNICPLYETAINSRLNRLESICIEFMAKNWKNVCKSYGFQVLNDSLCERLMSEIFGRKKI